MVFFESSCCGGLQEQTRAIVSVTRATVTCVPQGVVVVADVPRDDLDRFSRASRCFEVNEIVGARAVVRMTRTAVEQGADGFSVVKDNVKEAVLSVLFLVAAVQLGPLNFEDAKTIEVRVNVGFGGETWHATDEDLLREQGNLLDDVVVVVVVATVAAGLLVGEVADPVANVLRRIVLRGRDEGQDGLLILIGWILLHERRRDLRHGRNGE